MLRINSNISIRCMSGRSQKEIKKILKIMMTVIKTSRIGLELLRLAQDLTRL